MYLLATNYFQEILKMIDQSGVNTNQQCFDQIPNHADRSAETRKHADRCAEISAETRKNFKDSVGYFSPQRLLGILSNPFPSENTIKALGKFTRMEMLKSLLENDDINIKDDNGRAALMIAVKNNDLEMVKLLDEFGVDLNATDDDGKTALMIAVEKNNQEMVQFLMDLGANINEKDYYQGLTALMIAVENNNQEMVQFLIDNGANIDAIDDNGKTLLMIAVENYYLEMVQFLWNLGAGGINKPDKFGFFTPLISAASDNLPKLVKLLWDLGANMNVQNEEGWTALSITQNPEIIEFLLSKTPDDELKKSINKIAQLNPESLTYILHKNNISSVDNNLRKIDLRETIKDSIQNLIREVKSKEKRISITGRIHEHTLRRGPVGLLFSEVKSYIKALVVLANMAVFNVADPTDKKQIEDSIKFVAARPLCIDDLCYFYRSSFTNTTQWMCYIGFLMTLTKLGFFNISDSTITTETTKTEKNGAKTIVPEILKITFQDKESGKSIPVSVEPELQKYVLDFLMRLNSPKSPLAVLAKNVIKENIRSDEKKLPLPEPLQKDVQQSLPQEIIENIEILRDHASDSF